MSEATRGSSAVRVALSRLAVTELLETDFGLAVTSENNSTLSVIANTVEALVAVAIAGTQGGVTNLLADVDCLAATGARRVGYIALASIVAVAKRCVERSVDATRDGIARVDSAIVRVVTADGSVDTGASGGVASISGAH